MEDRADHATGSRARPQRPLGRAIVIGGSVAGVLAARVLSERYAQVLVLERDALAPAARRGVPQTPHLHGLLAGGLAALESLFPGFTRSACAAGGMAVDVGEFATWYFDGVRLPAQQTGLRGLLMSRERFEQHLRAQLSACANVELRGDVRVLGLTGSAWLVDGVRIAGAEGELPADLVVDASGHSSELPAWLTQFGLQAPSEDHVKLELSYTSCVIRREQRHLDGKDGFILTPAAPNPRGGAALAIEGGRYIVTLMGYLGARAPCSYQGMVEYARMLPDRSLHTLLRDAEPLGEPVQLRHPGSSRRRYERLKHVPRGLLALGDALCSINPAYGHGMTLAALQAHALRRTLDGESRTLGRRFFTEAARIIDIPWSMVAGADFEFAGARGTAPAPHPSIRSYFKRALRAAATDRDVALAVYRVMHLVEPPSALFAPDLVAIVLAQREPAPASLMLVPDQP